MTTRVYEYGLLPPITNATLVEDQIRGAHRYRNVLVEIERDRRTRVREILSGHVDTIPLAEEVDSLVAALEVARQALKIQRASTRSRSDSTADREAVRTLASQLKERRASLKEAKASIAKDPMIQRALTTVEKHTHDRRIEERARCTAHWGTYLLIEEDADRSRKSKMDPRFQRLSGEGRVSVQLQGGLDWSEITTDTQIQIHDRADPRTGRRANQRKLLRLRVGSEGSKPIWAEWPLTLHRTIPSGARIKRATVSKRRRDCRSWEWRVQLILDVTACTSSRPRGSEGACALNLGWAQTDRGLRVGYVVGTDGQEQEVVVPPSIFDRLDKSDSLRSIRDKNLDVLRPQLAAWLADHPFPDVEAAEGTPRSLKQRTEHLHAWRSAERFRALCFAWRQQRFEGDAEGHDLLEAWRYRDEHLQRYEAGMRRGALGHRREIYRIVAAKLAAQYRTLVVDDTDLRTFQRSPLPESERTEIDVVKKAQQRSAPSELRQQIVNAFGDAHTAELSSADVTRRCHACGVTNDWDRTSAGREHACSGCGVVWDQDANACMNLLREWRDFEPEWETARAAKEATRKESRSDRLRRGRLKKPPDEALAV